ncbi:hypothetical protein [Amycolatopsis sp. WAC 01416]|uniref:hypothetical protein n=1 Tax=Amycolatopsis sp. WAC 01416 TaxID=2203196 RepID=UPI001F2DD5CE|nr:hypothetical protein [Amycolatopsis sp. WAC 01416]
MSDGGHGLAPAAASLWGLGSGGAPTAFQAVTALIAGPAADAAQSLTIAAWNGAVAGGALIGGSPLPLGTGLLPWCAALVVLSPLLFSRRVVLSAPADRYRTRR